VKKQSTARLDQNYSFPFHSLYSFQATKQVINFLTHFMHKNTYINPHTFSAIFALKSFFLFFFVFTFLVTKQVLNFYQQTHTQQPSKSELSSIRILIKLLTRFLDFLSVSSAKQSRKLTVINSSKKQARKLQKPKKIYLVETLLTKTRFTVFLYPFILFAIFNN
jgi:predicted PurR-regulated permease PerM